MLLEEHYMLDGNEHILLPEEVLEEGLSGYHATEDDLLIESISHTYRAIED